MTFDVNEYRKTLRNGDLVEVYYLKANHVKLVCGPYHGENSGEDSFNLAGGYSFGRTTRGVEFTGHGGNVYRSFRVEEVLQLRRLSDFSDVKKALESLLEWKVERRRRERNNA